MENGSKRQERERAIVEDVLAESRVEDFEKLRGAPGICLEAVSWEELKCCVKENSVESLSKLGRHPSGIVTYRKFRQKVLTDYASMADFIKISILEHQQVLNPDNKRTIAEGSLPTRCPIWRKNDFPYNFEEGIEHHNVWAAEPLTEIQLVQVIEMHRKGWEYLHFVNPFPLASIPAVWHAHVVSRRQDEH